MESGGTSESQNGHLLALTDTAKQLSKVGPLASTPTGSEGGLTLRAQVCRHLVLSAF